MSDAISSSMLKKLKDFLIGRKNDEITPAEALKIQKASYTLNHTEVKKHFSPTYLSIVSGFESEEKQVFEATVYYLTKIIANKPKEKEKILEILKAKASENKINPEFREIIKNEIKQL